MKKSEAIVPPGMIEECIFLVRGQKIILDSALAELYGVSTKVLKQAVRRNRKRFPGDFMFFLARQEVTILRSQFVTSSIGRWGGARYAPMAFTEQGVAMLSGILNSPRAVRVNIAIMRAFVRLRETLAAHKELAVKLAELERKIESHDEGIRTLFEAIRRLMSPAPLPRRRIGFNT